MGGGGFEGAVEGEELRKQGQDECERDLLKSAKLKLRRRRRFTRSRRSETKITLRICFRRPGETEKQAISKGRTGIRRYAGGKVYVRRFGE